MELRELITIFRKQRNLFFGLTILFIFVAWVWQKEQGVTYQATLLLNIGRTGTSETVDYTYDSFYRLQADERFADTVVRWLTSPRVVEDIYHEAHLNSESLGTKSLSKMFTAGRLSSQMISVTYARVDKKELEEMSQAMVTVLNRYTGTLNTEVRDKNWFVVIGSDPVIRDGRIPLDRALLVGLIVGLFVSFWAVLGRHYWVGSSQQLPNNKQQ